MLKFFRKYNKAILAVGFALLMIIFLLPSGVSRLVGDPRNRPAFDYDGGVITQGELLKAGQDLQFLERLHPAFVPILLNVESPEHWIVLTRQAQRAGFVGGPEDGQNSLAQLAQTFADFELSQVYGSNYAQIFSMRDKAIYTVQTALEAGRAAAINNGLPAVVVDSILARAHGVIRLYTSYLSTQTLSTPELVEAAQDALGQVVVSSAHISAASMVDQSTPEPTEAQITEQFEKYKNTPPGAGEYGFGYQREPEIKLEWMIVSPNEIKKAVKLDPIDVNVHWQRNKDRFGDDFASAKKRVENELRKQSVDRALGLARQIIKGQFLQASGELPTNELGVPILPPDWASRRPSFEAVAQRVAEAVHDRMGIEIAAPDTLSDPRWLTRNAVSALPTIGSSRVVSGGRAIPLADLVFSVPKLSNDNEMRIQTGLAYPTPTLAPDGSLCFFRVLAARPTSPPESVDEVRTRVINDLKRLAEYNDLVARQSEILADAGAHGVAVASEPYHVNIIYPNIIVTRNAISRPGPASPEDRKKLRDAIVNRAATLDPTVPIDQIPQADRIVLFPQPSILSLALFEITSLRPMSIEQYQSVANQIVLSQRTSLRSNYSWPFSAKAMADRLHLVRVGDNKGDNDDEAATDSDADPTAAEDDAGQDS